MAGIGPAPTPTPILKARGSWRAKERERLGEPRPLSKAPACPSWLGIEAKKEWKRVVKLLLAIDCLAEIDRALLAAYCEAWAEFVKVSTAAEQAGLLHKTGTGNVVASPLLRIRDRAVDRLLRLAGQFGMSPAARARLRGYEESRRDEGDGEENFFGANVG